MMTIEEYRAAIFQALLDAKNEGVIFASPVAQPLSFRQESRIRAQRRFMASSKALITKLMRPHAGIIII